VYTAWCKEKFFSSMGHIMTKPTVPYDVKTSVITKTKKIRTQNIYLTWKEKVKLMKECGDAAVILLEFYMSKAGLPGYVYSDEKSAKSLDWTIHKVKKVRLKLQRANYYNLEIISDYRRKVKSKMFYLGKDAVLNSLQK